MKTDSENVRFAFVDESGDPGLDLQKQGTSQFYVVTAILVEQPRKDDLLESVDSIRAQFFGRGEMKSSSVGNDVSRRENILKQLLACDIYFYSLVADKSQIDSNSGLQYKKSFIKYLHGRLYERLYKSFTSLHVLADQNGRSSFMEQFKRYLEERYQQELFDHEDFSFVPSHECCLIQAADIISGTLRRIYSGQDSSELLDLLSRGAIIIERWPPNADTPNIVTGLSEQGQFDTLVAQQSIILAREFIRSHGNTDDHDILSQVETLRYLLYRYELNPSEYIYADPILNHVNSCRSEEMTKQSFRMNVIARLRSEGVIIASSNKGYKIPNTMEDIDDYVSLVAGQALPYLSRLAKARQQLLLSSLGKYDIVGPNQYPELHECLKILDNDSP